MINKNQECDIIEDLLPLYLDYATKEETNQFIQKHLEECESCRKDYELMKCSFADAFSLENGKRKKKIRLFKKIRSRLFLYGYVLLLVIVWLYCILDLIYFF